MNQVLYFINIHIYSKVEIPKDELMIMGLQLEVKVFLCAIESFRINDL